MSIIAELSVAPVVEGSMSEKIADAIDALDAHDVSYQTYPMGTVIEAPSLDELFRAVKAAHRAVDADRVSTLLKIDDTRTRERSADEKVASVRDALGRNPEETG